MTFSVNQTATASEPELNDLACCECGKKFAEEGFHYYGGVIDYGPAYFSDEGVLCSPECALEHYKKRIANGTFKK